MSDKLEAVKGNVASWTTIDIKTVIRQKSGKIFPFIPRFLISYLKRIIHQDEINDALYNYRDLMGHKFLETILTERLTADIEVRNIENLPQDGRYIVASNHPLGGLDGMALMYEVGKIRSDFQFIVNDILLELKNLQELFVPVNKHGRNSQDSLKIIETLYKSDKLILIFPAGLVSRKQKKNIIRDLDWKKSFITKAIKHHRDIIPVHIQGQNSNFFYTLAKWRKRLGIGINLEMLYLVDEMFKQADKKITITFGKPISYTYFTKEKTHQQWAQWMRDKVYEIGTK